MAAKSLVAMLKFSDYKQILLYDVKWHQQEKSENLSSKIICGRGFCGRGRGICRTGRAM